MAPDVARVAWAAPATTLGLLIALPALAFGATLRREAGALEIAGPCIARAVAWLPRRLRFAAITLGHVIVGVDHAVLARVRAHEHVHVAQYERWGPLFIPAYLASSVWQLLRGRDPYRDNGFEREAFRRGG